MQASCARSRTWKSISGLIGSHWSFTSSHSNFHESNSSRLADQIRRASKSVCANIAEGFARQRSSSADFQRFIVMALGSSDEMKVWLSFCADLGYVTATDVKRMRDDYSIVARMLHGLRAKWK